MSDELKVSVCIIDRNAVVTSKATVIKSNITQKEYDDLAKELRFTKKVVKGRTLMGYNYINKDFESLVTCPAIFKEGEVINL